MLLGSECRNDKSRQCEGSGCSFSAVTWWGPMVCWGKQMIFSTDLSLLKNSQCSLCTSLATREPACVFVQWSGWYYAGTSLGLSVVPLFKRTENCCPHISAVLLLFWDWRTETSVPVHGKEKGRRGVKIFLKTPNKQWGELRLEPTSWEEFLSSIHGDTLPK